MISPGPTTEGAAATAERGSPLATGTVNRIPDCSSPQSSARRRAPATERRASDAAAKSGTEITPAVSDALADEANRGYDLARFLSVPTPELYRAAQRRARQEGRTLSDLAREAVARYVK